MNCCIYVLLFVDDYLRNKSSKPECVLSFNMDWQILVFYPELEAREHGLADISILSRARGGGTWVGRY